MIPDFKLKWAKTEIELEKCSLQFRIIHDLPDVNGEKPRVYMEAALDGIRRRAIQIGWQRIELVKKLWEK
jgi:hypothetical protein